MNRFWVCYVEGTNGGGHYRHATQQNAQLEAERLARLPGHDGVRVFILECVGSCRTNIAPIIWEVPCVSMAM